MAEGRVRGKLLQTNLCAKNVDADLAAAACRSAGMVAISKITIKAMVMIITTTTTLTNITSTDTPTHH